MRDRHGRSISAGSSHSSAFTGFRGLTTVAAAAAAVALLVSGCGGRSRPGPHAAASPSATAAAGKLPQPTPFAALKGLPIDTTAPADGTVVHPIAPVTVAAVPGGPSLAIL